MCSVLAGYLMLAWRAKLDAVFPLIFHKRPTSYPIYWRYLVDVVEPTLFQ